MKRSISIATAAITLLLLVAPTASAQQQQRRRHPFEQGRFRGHISGGGGRFLNETYATLGGGIGYFLLDGLEIGFDVEQWFGGDPSITKISPQIRYVLYQVPGLAPYAGFFYRRWFITEGRPDFDTLGGRAGAYYMASGNAFFGAGVIYERVISECDAGCTSWYPEVAFSVTF